MDTEKNALTQDLPRPVQELTDAPAAAVEGGITCRKAGGDQQEYLRIKLTDILVSG
jgi:hypothetical protein